MTHEPREPLAAALNRLGATLLASTLLLLVRGGAAQFLWGAVAPSLGLPTLSFGASTAAVALVEVLVWRLDRRGP
jgi:hypothetical protein